jgi:UDP-N-acetylmuramate dehydrogenase
MSAPDALDVVADRLGDLVRREVPLGALTTYRVGGAARLLAEVADGSELLRLAEAVAGTGIDVLVVGKGSNLLVADAGFNGLAVVLGDGFTAITIGARSGRARRSEGAEVPANAEVVPENAEIMVEAGGAVALPVLARATAHDGLTGLEWAVGVPGSVGGAVRMNAGGHGSDVAATLRWVRVVDLASGEDGVMTADQLDLGYRRSALRATQVVISAGFGLRAGDAGRSMEAISEIVRWRRANQPGGQNAGSVFTNPGSAGTATGDAGTATENAGTATENAGTATGSAGRLIEDAGCRGLRWGSAQVSPKHANFIQADPGGLANDVRDLVELVRLRVEETSGIHLETELRLVGFDPLPGADPHVQVEVEG